jgi:hypothetical protein
MTLPFGWCSDGLHEACRDTYIMAWPPADYGNSSKKKDKVEQVEKLIECSCPCHGRVAGSTEAKAEEETPTPRPRQAPKKKTPKKQAARPRR